MNKNKLVIMIISVVLIAILVVGTTYALWPWWSSENTKTNVTFTTGSGFSCSADGGGNITQNDATLIPTSCTNSPYVIKRTITTRVVNSTSNPIYMDLKLKVNNISTELSNSNYFSYVLTDSSTSCTSGNIFSSGSFNGKTANSMVDILINDQYTVTSNKTYYLYIWLDTAETNNNTQNQNFNLELTGECSDMNPGTPNAPEVVNNLIPVKLSNSGDTVKAISASNTSWYDYSKKNWANAVLVDSTHRSNYQNLSSSEEVTIPENEILAYYVWIPRYSYQVWAYDADEDEAGEPHTIPIKFINTSTIDSASKIGDWYTHPAFWWDDDSDGVREAGEELSGIWVGKFETSHETLSSSTTNDSLGTDSGTICNSTGCNNYTGLRVLPNVESLRYNRIANFFNASRFMESSGNPFGLVSSSADTHMMKNSEWGAAAYLSHSKYGINDEVRLNNQSNYMTGCGALEANAAAADTCTIQYGTQTTYNQSTTGNVTGIFDMSGGAMEYVMSRLGHDYNDNDEMVGFYNAYPLPESKYYDEYDSTQFTGTGQSNFNFCTLATCGGHALNETKSWHNDQTIFLVGLRIYFARGASSANNSSAGVFASRPMQGYLTDFTSFRLVLVAE